ncbi:MAG: chloride channel protein [Verrucomicrobiota bacterium]|nr:chloride channel protein [Verrucomicrobiota bacterium]
MSDFFARQAQHIPHGARSIILTCIYGLLAGLAAVVFQFTMNALFNNTFVRLAQCSASTFLVGSFAVIVSTSLAVGLILTKISPEASGSGIPQVKAAFWKDFGFISWRVVIAKFFGGVLSVGGGSSLGREGPSVQLASGLSSNVAGMCGVAKQKRRGAAAAGAAAALAAAFNTPLAAMTFVLEEVIEDLNSRLLGRVLLASVIGALVVHGAIGAQPAFQLGSVSSSTWKIYLLTPVVAIVGSLLGVLFQKATMAIRLRRDRIPVLSPWMRPAIGGVVTWAIGSAVFLNTHSLGIFSLGYVDLTAALHDNLAWKLALILLVGKLIATTVCYGAGGCGGIFSPLLFFGGISGYCIAALLTPFLHFDADDRIVLAVVGMSACLGGVVRAPVTGILIVFEMTHEFSIVPALMIGALISQAISLRFCRHSFYDEILMQDGHKLEHVVPPRDLRSWQQLPISAIATFNPVAVPAGDSAALADALRQHPYRFFPVVRDDVPIGIVSRAEAQSALTAGRDYRMEPIVLGKPSQTVREVQSLLIESMTGVVILASTPNQKMIALVTLHDLLRTQAAAAESGA